LKATFKVVEAQILFPFWGNRFYPFPKSISIQGFDSILKVQEYPRRYFGVDTRIKIAGCTRVSRPVPFWTTKEVSEIDKIRTQPPFRVFREYSLTVIAMLGTDINEPCQPKTIWIADTFEAGPWQDFKESLTVLGQRPGTEAQARIWPKTTLRRLHPTVRILVQEIVKGRHWPPLRNGKPKSAIKLTTCALVEE
jgi:hypothetical protein